MEGPEAPINTHSTQPTGADWTYPTRLCRICLEDVVPTVTMYPPGVPMQFQTPMVEYKSDDDDYGRLIKPCKCRGSLRYIHELCLLRSRTTTTRANSMWKCHECGHQFNFKRLTAQRLLSSKISVFLLTVVFMVLVIFVLGFFADPIINIYLDPYDTLTGRESLWEELEVKSAKDGVVSIWSQHFAKGFISMGLVGFIKTILFNPFTYINYRYGGSSWGFGGSSGRASTGRDRSVAINWIAILVGITTAFVFFYRWVYAIVQRSLQRVGNNIVDTQLPGDDDDLKPPPGWKPTTPATEEAKANPDSTAAQEASSSQRADSPAVALGDQPRKDVPTHTVPSESPPSPPLQSNKTTDKEESVPLMSGSWVAVNGQSADDQHESAIPPSAHRQGWSFSNL